MSPHDPRHGTRAGYQAHRKVGQQACRPCLDAINAVNRARQHEGLALHGGRWLRRGLVYHWAPRGTA